jgi:hypothetical protein
MYPEGETGKSFWKSIYASLYATYGTTDVPVDTFNKVWIIPEKAVVYEDKGVAFIGESHLKVMLETDYFAMSNNGLPTGGHGAEGSVSPSTLPDETPLTQGSTESQTPSDMAKDIIRNTMLPIIEKEINEGANFAQLRQVYHSLILAAWYKRKIKDSLLSSVYVDQNKIKGVVIDDPQESVRIWERYVEAFKQGAYNYIKEERDEYTQELIPRKYFSGGFDYAQIGHTLSIKPMQALRQLGSRVRKTLLVTATLATLGVQTAWGAQNAVPNPLGLTDTGIDRHNLFRYGHHCTGCQ